MCVLVVFYVKFMFSVVVLLFAAESDAACSTAQASYSRGAERFPLSKDRSLWCQMPKSGTVT